MKEGYRFVDCDMHIMEPPDLFDKYLDPEFKHRVTSSARRSTGGPTGMRGRPLWYFDGTPTSNDGNVSQYNRIRGPLVSKRANTNVMFAVERGYDAESQVMGMAMEGINIAVLFPTAGLSFMARDNMDPQFSAAICRAYNDWIHDFVQHSPDQLKMAAMLPVHDVNLACAELYRCVKEYGAVGAFVRPNYVNGRYWHSNYWDPLYALLQELGVPLEKHGVPAHPGSMLWVAYHGDTPMLGLPSCGMYSRATAMDIVLPRLLTGERLDREQLAGLGHGGHLTRSMEFRFAPYEGHEAAEE